MIDENATTYDSIEATSDVEGQVSTEFDNATEDTVNEPQKQVSQEGKRSVGTVIADLGNEKKNIAMKLVELAKTNESARQQIKQDLLNDPSTAKYIKSKFESDYNLIVGDASLNSFQSQKTELDLEKIREEERTRAKADILKEQLQENQDKIVESKTKEYGFNYDELEKFKEKIQLLGGGEDAIADAALLVNHEKVNAKKGTIISGISESEAPKNTVVITRGLSEFGKMRGEGEQFTKDIHRVKSLHRLDAYGKEEMVLPSI